MLFLYFILNEDKYNNLHAEKEKKEVKQIARDSREVNGASTAAAAAVVVVSFLFVCIFNISFAFSDSAII